MSTRPHLDELHVVDIERVAPEPSRPACLCSRCGGEQAPASSWWATFVADGGSTFSAVLCTRCWEATRARLERDVFGHTGHRSQRSHAPAGGRARRGASAASSVGGPR